MPLGGPTGAERSRQPAGGKEEERPESDSGAIDEERPDWQSGTTAKNLERDSIPRKGRKAYFPLPLPQICVKANKNWGFGRQTEVEFKESLVGLMELTATILLENLGITCIFEALSNSSVTDIQ